MDGVYITIGYAATHLLLTIILAICIHHSMKKENKKIKGSKFAWSLWKTRGVYAPLLVHIYDTATDIGVLYEWYKLAEYEKNVRNLESIDMYSFFWTSVGFILFYRFVLGCAGFIAGLAYVEDVIDKMEIDIKHGKYHKRVLMFIGGLIGFIVFALEFGLFFMIYIEQKDQREEKEGIEGAGNVQKGMQTMEGILESLPEVVFQSVFIMRSLNDPILNDAAGNVFLLMILSIMASILSITSKYVWMDQLMVMETCKTFLVKKNHAILCAPQMLDKFIDAYEAKHDITLDADVIYCVRGAELYMSDVNCNYYFPPSTNRSDLVDSVNGTNIESFTNVESGASAASGTSVSIDENNGSFEIDFDQENKTSEANLEKYFRMYRQGYYFSKRRIKHHATTIINNLPQKSINKLSKRITNNRFNFLFHTFHNYFISWGFVVRLLWRLSAVSSRFIIFGLIWVVLGGAFMIILLPSMAFMWYVIIISYVLGRVAVEGTKNVIDGKQTCTDCCKNGCQQYGTVCDQFCDLINDYTCGDCWTCIDALKLIGSVIGIIFGVIIGSLIFQLGIFGISGKTLYIVRMVENIILISIITAFGFIKFECDICANPYERSAINNGRILLWIIVGWISIIMHIITSSIVNQMIDHHTYQFSSEKMFKTMGIQPKMKKKGARSQSVAEFNNAASNTKNSNK